MTTGQTSTIYVGQFGARHERHQEPRSGLAWVASKTIDPKASPRKQPEKSRQNRGKALKELSSSAEEIGSDPSTRSIGKPVEKTTQVANAFDCDPGPSMNEE